MYPLAFSPISPPAVLARLNRLSRAPATNIEGDPARTRRQAPASVREPFAHFSSRAFFRSSGAHRHGDESRAIITLSLALPKSPVHGPHGISQSEAYSDSAQTP